jgi:hypothetical protein
VVWFVALFFAGAVRLTTCRSLTPRQTALSMAEMQVALNLQARFEWDRCARAFVVPCC